MQKRSTDRSRAAEQRDVALGASETATRAPAALRLRSEPDEVTLGGHVDRGLTLGALYEIGIFERLRIGVRVRLLADLSASLAWSHSNQRLMAAYPYLALSPSIVVIGLDGVARVDLRAAKKLLREGTLSAEYGAPEIASGIADQRADLYALGVVIWEMLAGKRLLGARAPSPPARKGSQRELGPEATPIVLGGAPVVRREMPRAPREPEGTKSHTRLRAVPFPVLPSDASWALPLAQMAVQAMHEDPERRPRDCRALLEWFDSLDPALLASHQEIAEVVQGIASVSSLCEPEPSLPRVDSRCAAPGMNDAAEAASVSRCADVRDACAQPDAGRYTNPPRASARPAPGEAKRDGEAFAREGASLVPATRREPRVARESNAAGRAAAPQASVYPRAAWIALGLIWILTFGLFAGFVVRALLR